MPKVSVIIPVYNVEKYLAKCLDSVINQTYKDIEIICINDGSTDNSLKILQDYAKKDDRIKIINQKNSGVSVARNKGIKSAKGEFICFVDADDFLQSDTCELSLNQTLKTNADICCFGINEVINKKVTPRAWEKFYLDSYENKEFDIPTIKCFLCNACGKLFKTSFIQEHSISFPLGIKSGEDSIFNLECLFFSPKYTLVNKYLYNYVKDISESASHNLANLVKYDIEGFKYFFATPLFKNASEELQLIALEKFFGQLLYYYDNIIIHRLKYLREISSFRKYLKDHFSKELLSNVPNFEELTKASITANIFSIRKSIDKKHKILTIFGLKLKFKRKKKDFSQKIFKNYNKTLTKLRKDVHHRKLRVCFLVSETAKWNAQSVYNELKKSPYFEPFIVVTNLQNRTNRPAYSHLLEFYRSCADDVKIGWDEQTKQGIDLKNFSPDIVFYQQPWELYKNQDVKYVSNFALTYHFSYAMSDSIHCIKSMYKDFYSLLYKYFVFSKAEEDEYKSEMRDKGANLAVVGHPKLDVYKGYKEEDYEHKYVIYAPHHSFEKDSLNFATFQWNGTYILEYAEKHPEFNWVFKPHPRFKSAVIQNNIMSAEEIEEYYKRWEKIGICYNDGLYFDLFKQAKCLITDCGSFLIEFLPTKQPVIVLMSPNRHDDIPSVKLATQSYYQTLNMNELEKALEDVLIKNNDPRKTERLQVLEKLNIEKYDSTSKIINELKNNLGLEIL